jgi:predicted alpha/beta superfamily hydrolase
MIKVVVTVILFLSSFFASAQDISVGVRDNIHSEILNENRPISIYLPPSYYKNQHQKFPVLYILDGDYNFRYVTGLIELQSSISENIPEMIVVGISGKGTQKYRENCKPNIKVKDKGNADKVLLFMEKELLPWIHNNYKVNGYNILAGHSIGGIFIINAALNKPTLFNHYIAISPALWWEDNAMHMVAKEVLEKNANFKSDIYISLANEKGMEVSSFLKEVTKSVFKYNIVIYLIVLLFLVLAIVFYRKSKMRTIIKKLTFPILSIIIGFGLCYFLLYQYYPTNNNFHFKKFTEENHNSVGEPTYKWALNTIFNRLKVDKQYFDNAVELEKYYQENKNIYKVDLNVSNGLLANTVFYILNDNEKELLKLQEVITRLYPNKLGYYNSLLIKLYSKNKEYNKAANFIKKEFSKTPQSVDLYKEIASFYKEQKKLEKANLLIEKALKLSKSQHLRQWEINELTELKEQINKDIEMLQK